MASKITYTSKVDRRTTTIAPINKVTAADLNEVKTVVNSHADELETLVTGWAQYNDTQYTVGSPFALAEGATAVMPMNGGHNIKTYLPTDTTDLYSVAGQKITPTNIGDAYVVAIRFRAKNNNNFGSLSVGIDIGGALGTFVEQSVPFSRDANTEQYFNIIFNLFTLDTFVANGGTMNLTAVKGNLQVYEIRFVFTRVYRGKPI